MCGKESIDYNGGIVPGLIASKLNYNFVNLCTNLELQENEVLLKSESDEGIINIKSKASISVMFDDPQFAIAPGQSIEFYDKDICLGGGVIDSKWN